MGQVSGELVPGVAGDCSSVPGHCHSSPPVILGIAICAVFRIFVDDVEFIIALHDGESKIRNLVIVKVIEKVREIIQRPALEPSRPDQFWPSRIPRCVLTDAGAAAQFHRLGLPRAHLSAMSSAQAVPTELATPPSSRMLRKRCVRSPM